MNAIYSCCIANPWINVSVYLRDNYNIQPVYFIHWRDETNAFNSEAFQGCYFQTVEDAWKGKGFPKNIAATVLDEAIIKKIAWYESVAIKMMDRLDPIGGAFSFSSRQYFFYDLVGYWFSVVNKLDIDIVFSPSVPHRVFDYALYVVCQILDIEFLSFQMTPFGANSFILDSVDSLPKYHSEEEDVKSLPSQEIQEYINKVKGKYLDAVPDYMKRHEEIYKSSRFYYVCRKIISLLCNFDFLNYIKEKPNTYWVVNDLIPKEVNIGWFKLYTIRYKAFNNVKAYKKLYSSMVCKDLPLTYVLVALHYQPEETSSPTGGSYVDQSLIIKLLNEVLPSDICIVVKEHKSQFYTHLESSAGRNEMFYKRLSSISNRIYFAAVDEDPFKLIDDAQATVTISGTIGWESAIRGTPAIVFGRAWYENMPRVFKIKTKKQLKDAWEDILNSKGLNMDEEIMSFHACIEKYFINAIHYKSYGEKKYIENDVSFKNIAEGIISHLERKHFVYDL